ncbi:MAG: tripartite tricarboxylate transporter substrate binding protein [Burkholderiales bacterium]|nr:tripartite tricarboxylate transporter substrate binding protein [Burkholderiales bacterium]
MIICLLRGLAAALLLAAAAPAVLAQTYPAKGVRIVVAYPPGGATDVVTRVLAEHLSRSLGQPFVVENRPGAGGLIGSDVIAKAAPDGYSLLMGVVSSHAIAPSAYKSMPYDPIADFSTISLAAGTSFFITVHPSVPAQNLAELIQLARARPGTLNFGSSGKGTTPHLAGELFNSMARVQIQHVPYKGSAPMLADLLGGQIQVAFDNTVVANVRAGKLRALATTGPRRVAALPDVPTAAEAGLAGYEVVTWMGMMGPRGLPAPIAARIAGEMARIMVLPEVVERLATLGFQPLTNTPTQFAEYLAAERAKWAKAARDAGIEPE